MQSISHRIAYPIIITGLFIIVVFISVFYELIDPNFYIVLIPLTGFLFLFGFAIGQRFALPVKKILQEADHLSRGNAQRRLYVDDKDEFGQLARAFNKIADTFEHNKSKIESLDANVRLRTKALEEIIEILEEKVKNRTAEFDRATQEEEALKEQVRLKDEEIAALKESLIKRTQKRKKAATESPS